MNQQPGIIGRKIGNTQFFDASGDVQRVTVVAAGPVTVVGKRTKEKDGYVALVLGMDDAKEKHLSKPVLGAFKKANIAPKRTVRELRCDEAFAGKFEVGAVMKLDEVFEVGQKVDAKGKTRGRGFTGVMRRWNFAGAGSNTHGTHEYRRHGGSIGTNMTPGRTLPNLKMGGHYGDETVSMLNLEIVKMDVEKHLLFIAGGVPGAKNSVVLIRHGVKARAKKK
jgi:large subunit ribosomal protein L3